MASETSGLQNKCNHCSFESNNLKRCSKCKSKYYCNNICQKKDWFLHKQFCKSQTEVKLSHSKVDKSDGLKKREDIEKNKLCANCGSHEDGFLFSCSRCNKVFYCSKACQRQHWKMEAGHKNYCLSKDDGNHCSDENYSEDLYKLTTDPELRCCVCLGLLPLRGEIKLMCCQVSIHLQCFVNLRVSNHDSCPQCRIKFPSSIDKDIKQLIIKFESRQPLDITLKRNASYNQDCLQWYFELLAPLQKSNTGCVSSLFDTFLGGYHELDKDNPFEMGSNYFLNHDFDLARSCFEEIIKHRPSNEVANAFLCFILKHSSH
jgi:hypothetical protein